jgi:SAM-dependent methyltransferase
MTLNCPLCSANDFSVIHKLLEQDTAASIVKCTHCLHIYTLIDQEPEPGKLYNDHVYKVVDNRSSIFDKILNWEYKRVIKRISSFKPSKGTLLDFGSGKGKFAHLAKHNGWDVKCVETATERAAYAEEVYGLEVNRDVYSTGKIFNKSFDVLALFHVLEHLPNPGSLVKELTRSNLNKKALIVIEVPNFKSWQSRIAGKRWLQLDATRHIHHFTPSRLEEFAREINTSTLRTTFFSLHVGMLGMTDSLLKLFGYRGNIIYELKNKKNKALVAGIILLLPFSFLLEVLASTFGRGGIIRKYLILDSII